MRNKITAFYRGKTGVHVDFSAGEISSDGAVVLLEKLERKHKLISYFSEHMTDRRHPLRIIHSMEKLLKQRVFTLMQGYEDTNDVAHLKNDPLFEDILDGEMASQPTLSRFENSLGKRG
ncbi:MAG: transposase, partial [Cytophagales bacterium]|nr:transposase [Cytophagales bacterium]